MIPKKIHYCWFGRGRKNELIDKCMLSWAEFLDDYEIVEWNEDNFDISSNKYVKQAYESKKWAFVSDYVRLYALKEHGGIYLDTDVEVFKSFDVFLEHDAFSGFENYKGKLSPITAVMGAKKNHAWIAELLSDYDELDFKNINGSTDIYTNTLRITNNLIENYNVKIEDKYQILGDGIHIYPSVIFCNYSGGESYSMHHFNGSWVPIRYKIRSKIKGFIRGLLG